MPKPYSIIRRTDSKSYRLTLHPSCGLPERVCDEWFRKSFKHLPTELANHRYPQTKVAAETAVFALVQYLKKRLEEDGSARRISTEDITVGDWMKKFTRIDTSPRTGINASKNRPYSVDSLNFYKSYYECHIKNDVIASLKMAETEEEDILEFMSRLSVKKKLIGKKESDQMLGGTRTATGVIKFFKMAFKQYQRKNRKWLNPFMYIDLTKYEGKTRDHLPEDEMLQLFMPGILTETMDLAVCGAMFLSGLRRAEVFALKPEDLDWHTPKIMVRRAWQMFDYKDKVLGPPKGKKERKAPFDPILQAAIKKLWAENGQHEFVFSRKDGSIPSAWWIGAHFEKWLNKAGIELNGREIVPHSSRHSLASLLEARNVSLRYIQELLGHSDLKTTINYLHSTSKTIRDIGSIITEATEKAAEPPKEDPPNVIKFKAS